MSRSSSATLMTEGPIWKRMVAFAVPLFWGNLFQQLYNTVDSLIVGNFMGNNALAAVSSSGQLILLMVGFFNGIGIGSGIVIAKNFGARNMKDMRKAMHTAIGFALVCGIFITVMAEIAAPMILKLIGVPDEVLPSSMAYFRVYFAGSLGFVLYNFSMGILQALGDSKHPLIYLIISSVTNVVLDFVLIAGLHFGVGAAAFATLVSQCLSAFLCIWQIAHNPEDLRLNLWEICLDKGMLKQIVSNGIPAGIQNSIVGFANVFVQSQINSFGAGAMAGSGSYFKIEGFAFMPVTCFCQTLTTFISQNLGAEKYDRAKKGAVFGVSCSMFMAEIIGVCIFSLAPLLIEAFGGSGEAVQIGVMQARTISLFYCLLAFSHCMGAIQRGAGRSFVPMLVMMIVWCGIRILYISIAIRLMPVINVVFWAYPITWTISSVVFLIIYKKTDWIHGLKKSY